MNISLKKIGVLFLFVASIFIIQFFLVACSQSVEFTIYFDSNGGSEVSSIKTDGTSSITLPNDPIKDGYSFAGWYWDNGTFRDLFTVNSLLERGISGNLTVYAKWNEEDTPIGAIKVTFNSMGGSEVNPQYVQKDNTIAIPNTSKVGYTLDGWYTSLNNGQTFDEKWSFTNNKVTTDITLYAKWIINQYTITFNSNGGSSVSSITQDYDTLVIAPANPTKLGYTFSGWSQPVPIKMPAEDVTLIAEWSINQYTITFNSNGGSPVTAITQDYATTVSKPTDPTKVGYTFAGWYSDSNLSMAYTFTTMPAKDITLYAKWNIITYSINYELDGGFTSGNPTAYTVDTNTITLTIPTKEGYTFDGWYLEPEFVTVKTQIIKGTVGNLTLYAKWTLNSYTLSFNSNGGSPVTAITQDYATTVSKPTDPTKVGYTFAGWYSDSNLSTAYTFTTMPAKDITLYAKWNIITYNINYELDGGFTSGNPTAYTVDTNTITLTIPTKEGYTFDGWYLESEFVTVKTQIIKGTVGNLTLYAKWTLNSYTLSYDSNGGSPVPAITQDYATTVSKPTDPIKVGYTFAGWYSDSNLSMAYTFTTMPAKDITLYAKWNIITYNINYELDGGFTSGNPTAYTVDTNTITLTIPTKEGYTFDGWYLESEFVTVKTQIIKGTVGNLTLYAKWTLNSYTLSYDSNGGSPVTAITQDYATTVSKPTDPTKVGYTFAGWYINSSLTTSYTFTTMPAQNITLYAKWVPLAYNINYELADGLNHLSNPSSYTIETNTIILSAPIKEGYTFEGWYSDSNFTNYVSEITIGSIGNLTLYAKWQNTITFNTNGGSLVESITQDYGTTVIQPNDPTREGYTFGGWFSDSGLAAAYTFSSMPAQNITLYAKWQNTITFNTNGGTEISPTTQDYGTAIHVLTTKEGYMFAAWCSDEGLTTSIDISKMPNANLTVYAKWAQMYEYFTIDNMTYVYYGTYPQTVVDDSSLISSLNSLTSTNANGYYEFEGEEYAKVVANPYPTGYQFINGSTIQSGQTYYFKVEPIKWRVLEEADGTYTLLSEYIIDKQVFYTSSDNRTIGDQTIYANNYEHSTIREWLNNAFYNKAFSTPEKGSILTTLIDNSASTTSSSTNPYASNNTMDKVYLLSYQEARSSTYGFSTYSTIRAVTTDYARAVGANMDTSTSYYGNGYWWLRSPYYYYSFVAHYVDYVGRIYNNSHVSNSSFGARPAIKIG